MFSLLLLMLSHKWKILNKSNDALLDCFKNCWTSWQIFNISSSPVTLIVSLWVRRGITEHSWCTHFPWILGARWPAGSAGSSMALSTRPWDRPCPRAENTACASEQRERWGWEVATPASPAAFRGCSRAPVPRGSGRVVPSALLMLWDSTPDCA